MSFNNNSSTDLSRFSIGEIQDLSGVSDFYNAGSSKWLKSGIATSSSNLSNTTKSILAAAGTAADQTVLAQGTLSSSYNGFGFYATYPIERISASSVSVVPAYYQGSTAVGVGVVTSAGLQAVSTGQTSNRTASASAGSNAVVAGNNTTIFSYCFTSATNLNVAYTTNGTTWTAGGTATGLPVFASDATTIAHASASNSTNTWATMAGWKRAYPGGGGGQFAVFWCGARFLVLGPGTGQTYFVASLSTNGIAFGGDNTTAVLGTAVQAVSSDIQFYRNGNSCFLAVGGSHRFSTDGGVTWAITTGAGAAAFSTTTGFMQVNTTDPAKLFFLNSTGSTAVFYSADSGASWSADRPIPFSNPNGGMYYKGSTLVISNGSTLYYVSTDNGVTWTTPTFPVGVLSTSIKFTADANRFYAGVNSQKQILTSSDAVTWTLLTLTQNYSVSHVSTLIGYGIVAYDSNTVVILGYSNSTGANQCFFTLDGGVTWTGAQYTVSGTGANWGVGSSFLTPDGGGICFAYGMSGLTGNQNTPVFKTDITGGGAFYRTGSTAISPIRTGALSWVRVG